MLVYRRGNITEDRSHYPEKCSDICFTGRQISGSVTEDVLAFGIVLHKFFTEEETAMNYTYIVQCADGTLYTGWTNCLARRMKAHNEGKAGARIYPGQKAGEAGVL